MNPEEMSQLLAALDKQRSTPPTTSVRNGARLKDWIPIILTTLAVAGTASVIVFKTNSDASADHKAIEASISVERVANVRQDGVLTSHEEKLDDSKEAFKVLNRNIRKLASRQRAESMEAIPE